MLEVISHCHTLELSSKVKKDLKGRLRDPFGKTDEKEPLTNAVRSDSAIIGGVIAVVIFIIFSIIGIMTRFLYQHKQSHRTNQMKEKEYPENLDSSFRNDIDLQNTVSECKREYFI